MYYTLPIQTLNYLNHGFKIYETFFLQTLPPLRHCEIFLRWPCLDIYMNIIHYDRDVFGIFRVICVQIDL